MILKQPIGKPLQLGSDWRTQGTLPRGPRRSKLHPEGGNRSIAEGIPCVTPSASDGTNPVGYRTAMTELDPQVTIFVV